MHAYSFFGLNEADPRASSEGREGTEAIPLGDVFCYRVIVGERLEENETSFNKRGCLQHSDFNATASHEIHQNSFSVQSCKKNMPLHGCYVFVTHFSFVGEAKPMCL